MSWLRNKLKAVAARASDALAQAADFVAPTLYDSRVAEFHQRWTTIARFLDVVTSRDLDPAEQRRVLLDSRTRDSLQKLVLLIFAEENAMDREELTHALQNDAVANSAALHDAETDREADAATSMPASGAAQSSRECLEYLLEHQVIPTLCNVGKLDQPCGIMALAMQFVAALVSRVNYPILPTREVHISVIALIQAAAKKEVDDPIVRKCLINLLNILWKKLRGDPVQTECFFLHADRHMDSSELVLFTALLPHMYAVGKVGEKCREALAIAAGVQERALIEFVLQLTPFCHYAVNGVISAFDMLPKSLSGKAMRDANAKTNPARTGGIENELEFLTTRLRFCCTLAMVGRCELAQEDGEQQQQQQMHTSITHEILRQFRRRFLDGPLLHALMDTSEAAACTAMLYARIMLEELASSCRDTSANPLLLVYVQYFVQRQPIPMEIALPSDQAKGVERQALEETGADRRLPLELINRISSLSSSVVIAALDLFSSLLELQDEYVDSSLLGLWHYSDAVSRHSSVASASAGPPTNGAIWLASRFPNSAVAANAHVWKIPAFDALGQAVEIPASAAACEGDSSEEQIVSLLSYIADAEYVTCQRAPAVIDDWESDNDQEEADQEGEQRAELPTREASAERPETSESCKSDTAVSPGTSRTAATRSAMRTLKHVALSLPLPSYSPVVTAFLPSLPTISNAPDLVESPESPSLAALFKRAVLSRVERMLESAFHENLSLSGLVSVLAQKPRCSAFVFDLDERVAAGDSVRSVLEDVHADALRRADRLPRGAQRLVELRRMLVEENNETALPDHEPETRLLCGFVVLEELLKELCSILFARERVRSLPVKPEGHYLNPSKARSLGHVLSSDNLPVAPAVTAPAVSIGAEFEQLIAEAEATMRELFAVRIHASSCESSEIPPANEPSATRIAVS